MHPSGVYSPSLGLGHLLVGFWQPLAYAPVGGENQRVSIGGCVGGFCILLSSCVWHNAVCIQEGKAVVADILSCELDVTVHCFDVLCEGFLGFNFDPNWSTWLFNNQS